MVTMEYSGEDELSQIENLEAATVKDKRGIK